MGRLIWYRFALGNEEYNTNLIFRLLQLSQARCVFVRFLPSDCPAALAEPPRGGSPVESVGGGNNNNNNRRQL